MYGHKCILIGLLALQILALGHVFHVESGAATPEPATLPVISFCLGGGQHCVVFNNKKMKCAGMAKLFGLSTGNDLYGTTASSIGDNLPYVDVGTNAMIEEVACGVQYTCVKLDTGDVKCIGSNQYGQIGIGVTLGIVGAATGYGGDNLPAVKLGNGVKAISIVAGSAYLCVKVTGNKVKCYGHNDNGQLGYGDKVDRGRASADMDDNLQFVDLGTNVEIASIHADEYSFHSCAILSAPTADAGRFKCWGFNDQYQLGYGDTNNRGDNTNEMGDMLPLVDLGSESRVKQISVDYASTCAILLDNTLKCFGSNALAQLVLGNGNDVQTTGNAIPLVPLDSQKTIKFISSGFGFVCILYDDQLTLKCAGFNVFGQLGQGDTATRGNTPTTTFPGIPAINLGTGSLKISSFSAGNIFTCVVFENSLIKCFGYNELGLFATGSALNIGDQPGEMGSNLKYSVFFSPTTSPTKSPTFAPSFGPTMSPSFSPSLSPASSSPSKDPTLSPTNTPTDAPATFTPTKGPGSFQATPSKAPATGTPTKTPTKAPTYSPSSAPATSNPTKSPNKAQTTKTPTQDPTPPTAKSPTKNPTRKPSLGFFGSQESSLPFCAVDAFDLYLLIDTTRNYEKQNVYCTQYKLMSGASPSSCFDLMMDYAIEIVKSISVATNGYYSNDLSKGLRVQASLIQCVGSTKTPSSTTLFALTGDSSIIMNGLNNARTNTQLTETASCPLQGLYNTIQRIENSWNDVGNSVRPYKAIITLTDAQVNDATNPGVRLIDVVSGIRYRCTPSIVVVPFRMTDTSPQALTQQLSLKILTGNIDSSVFEAKNAPWIVIPKIGEQITSLLMSSNTRCSSSTSFSTADKYWCGYNTRALCLARTSCEFVTGPGCQKKQSQSGCNFGDQTSCTSNTQCQWVSSACTRKPEEPDCNALVLQSSCNSKSSFCSWNGSGCVINSVG